MGTRPVFRLEGGCEYNRFILQLYYDLTKFSISVSVATAAKLEKNQYVNKLINISLN